MGAEHTRVYAQLSGARLVGVADVREERAREIGSLHRVEWFTDPRRLYDRVDAVSIAVPTDLHYDVARGFLRRGIHVLLEKPITGTVRHARVLMRLAGTHSALLQVGHIERFNAAFRAIEGKVDEPRFIECHRLAPFQERGTEVGVVLDLMIHDIDIILHLVSSPIKRIDAVGVSVLSEHEDIVSARLLFEGGCVANVTASRVSRERLRKLRIFQRSSYLSVDYLSGEVVGARRRGREIAVERTHPENRGEPLRLEIEEFLDCVRSGRTPRVSAAHAAEALRVGLAIVKRLDRAG